MLNTELIVCLQADLVYLNYGTWNDFESANSSQALQGKVALVRSGVISLEHKVIYRFLLTYVLLVNVFISTYTRLEAVV